MDEGHMVDGHLVDAIWSIWTNGRWPYGRYGQMVDGGVVDMDRWTIWTFGRYGQMVDMDSWSMAERVGNPNQEYYFFATKSKNIFFCFIFWICYTWTRCSKIIIYSQI